MSDLKTVILNKKLIIIIIIVFNVTISIMAEALLDLEFDDFQVEESEKSVGNVESEQ